MSNPKNTDVLKRFVNLRPLSMIALGFIVGILLDEELDSGFIAAIIILAALAALILSYFRKHILACFAAALALGIICMIFAAPNISVDGVYAACGRVHSLEKNRIILSDVKLNGTSFNKYIALDCDEATGCSLNMGDHVEFTAGIEFSHGTYMLARNIGANAVNVRSIHITDHDTRISDILQNTRDSIGRRIDTLFKRNAPMVRGILLGDTSYMESEDLTAVRASGLAHIMALSGLHISIIAGFLNIVLKGLGYKVRAVVVVLFLFLYMAVVGFPPSLVRAGIMTSLTYPATLTRRRYDSLSALALSAVIILLFNPYQIFTAGFLMSFGAVLVIILISSKITDVLSHAIDRRIANSVSVSVSATLGTLPPVLMFFGSVSVYGPIVNTVAIPIASLGVICAFLGVLLGYVWDIAAVPFTYTANIMLDAIKYISYGVSEMPYALVRIENIPLFPCILIYALIFSLSDYLLVNRRVRYMVFGAVACMTVISLFAL